MAKALEGVELSPMGGIPEKLREIKDEAELDSIRRAAAIASDAFMNILPSIHAGMTEKDIAAYAKELRRKYPEIDEANLRKLIRNEVNRKKPTPLYDLDYDVQLNEAIHILTKENFNALVKGTKTLKELQESALLGEKK